MKQFELGKVKPHKHKGRPKKDGRTSEEIETMRTVLQARCDLMGWGHTESNLRRVRQPQFGSTAGVAIEKAGFDRDLFDFVTECAKSWDRYYKSIGQRITAQNAAIQMFNDEVFLDPEEKPREELTEAQIVKLDIAAADRVAKLTSVLHDACGGHSAHVKAVIVSNEKAKSCFVPMLRRFYDAFSA